MELSQLKLIFLVFSLGLLFFLEQILPFYEKRKNVLSHDLKNISLGIINSVIAAVLFTSLFLWAESIEFGLFRNTDFPFILQILLIILTFDLWMYTWHVANHKLPFLWVFHKVHHTDPKVDATSAVRFHPFEIILSSIARIIIVILLGLNIWHILIYELILLPAIIFHHSNVRFPEKYDTIYRGIFASPHMHRIHHSEIPRETDSNYGSIFSFWDRIFKTFRLRKKPIEIVQGLKDFKKSKYHTLRGILSTPFHRS